MPVARRYSAGLAFLGKLRRREQAFHRFRLRRGADKFERGAVERIRMGKPARHQMLADEQFDHAIAQIRERGR